MPCLEHTVFRVKPDAVGHIPPFDIIAEISIVVVFGAVVCAGGELRRVVRSIARRGRIQRNGDGVYIRRHSRELISDLQLVPDFASVCGLAAQGGRGAGCEGITVSRRQINEDPVHMPCLEYVVIRVQAVALDHVQPFDVVAEIIFVVGLGVVGITGVDHRRIVRMRACRGRIQ